MGLRGMRGRTLAVLGALASLGLAACGGGGGGGGAPAPVLPPVSNGPGGCTTYVLLDNRSCTYPGERASLASAADSLAEWNNDLGFSTQPALEIIKAHYAYSTGNTGFDGSGVTVAVLSDSVAGATKPGLQEADGTSRVTRIGTIPYDPRRDHLDAISLNALDAGHLPNNNLVDGRYGAGGRTDCGWTSGTPYTCWGTAAASIIAGKTLDSSLSAGASLMGVAPGAHLLDIPEEGLYRNYCSYNPHISGSSGPRYSPVGCNSSAKHDNEAHASILAAAMRAALTHEDNKARYIYSYRSNYPRGTNGSGPFGRYLPVYGDGEGPAGENLEYQQRLLEHLGAVVWQGGPYASADRSVFVFPAGDDAMPHSPSIVYVCADFTSGAESCATTLWHDPRLYAMLPRIAQLVGSPSVPRGSDLAATFLTVVALGSTADANGDYPIHSGSNRCGRAAAWCLAAPGQDLKTYSGGANTQLLTGTSYAAALVTGALALVDSAFNEDTDTISPTAIRKRLLDTADREGIYATGAIYGQGLVNIQAALSPQGTSAMPSPPGGLGLTSTVRAGASLPLHGLALALPGHALDLLGATRVMTLDSQGFPFYLQLRDLAHAPFASGSLHADMMAPRVAQGPAAVAPIASGLLDISAGVGSSAAWGSALTPQHLAQGGQAGGLAAGAHLAVSPLMASSLEAGDTSHVAVRASFGQQAISALACTQRHTQRGQDSVQGSGDNACMALGWDWNSGDSFGLSVRAHALDSRGGLYRYGARCFGGSCAGGGATATELGLGGFAKLSQGLRLGWNYWHGWADDLDGGSDVVRYAGLGHSAGSIALEGADGVWSLYVQQPLRAEGSLQLVLPERRDSAGNVYFARHDLRLDGASRPVRLGLSSRLDLTRRGGFMALDLGAERGLHGYAGTHPYLALQTSIPW